MSTPPLKPPRVSPLESPPGPAYAPLRAKAPRPAPAPMPEQTRAHPVAARVAASALIHGKV